MPGKRLCRDERVQIQTLWSQGCAYERIGTHIARPGGLPAFPVGRGDPPPFGAPRPGGEDPGTKTPGQNPKARPALPAMIPASSSSSIPLTRASVRSVCGIR